MVLYSSPEFHGPSWTWIGSPYDCTKLGTHVYVFYPPSTDTCWFLFWGQWTDWLRRYQYVHSLDVINPDLPQGIYCRFYAWDDPWNRMLDVFSAWLTVAYSFSTDKCDPRTYIYHFAASIKEIEYIPSTIRPRAIQCFDFWTVLGYDVEIEVSW